MSIQARIVLLVFVILLSGRPGISNGDETIWFEQGAIDIPTSLYGAFLIDRDGFVWIGTTGLGVYRYDGYELKSFSASVQGSMISSIVEDKEGLIWIASFSNGITSYNKEAGLFTEYNHDPANANSLCSSNISFSPQKLFSDSSNRLWVGTDDAGLCVYNNAADTWTHYKHNPDDSNSLSDNAVMAIAEGSDDTLWVGTQTGGLNRLNLKTGTWTHYRHDSNNPDSLSDNWINSILEDKDGVLWIGTKKGGLNRFDKERGVFTHYIHDPTDPQSISGNNVSSSHEDYTGRIWVSHMGSPISGLDLLDKERGTFTRHRHDPDDPATVSSNAISRVYGDQRAKTVWIVNYDGRIDRHDKSTTHFRHWPGDRDNPTNLSDSLISPIIEDSDNMVWVGTVAGGLNRIDRKTGEITNYFPDSHDPHSIPHPRVAALREGASGTLWIGFWNGVLASFDRRTGRTIHIYKHDSDDPNSITESDRLKYILEDRDDPNILWLATIKGGLDRFDKNKEQFKHYKHNPSNSNSLSHNSMATLYDDGKGVLWIPTYGGGLDKFDKKTETFTNYRHEAGNPNSLGSNTLYEVLEMSNGDLWISRKGGISHFNKETGIFKNFDQDDDGVPFGAVASLLKDDDGHLWLGTVGGGIVRFDPKTGATKRFTVDDGLQGNTFFWTSRLKAKNGEMWFGGSNGISSFHPSRIKENPHVPPIVLTAFTQGGQPVSTGTSPERLREVTLDWRSNYFEFQFAALSFTAPEKNRYAYTLEGWDEDWYYSDSNPFGRYSGLAGGRYKLRLRGSNNDGVWNDKGVSVNVIVTSPVWETGWFNVTIVAVGLAILMLVVFYLRKLRVEITERKQAEEEIKSANSLLSSVIESPDNIVIFALDTNYNYLGFNQSHAAEMNKVYGADIEVGQNILTYIPRADDRLKAEENCKRALKGERFIEIEQYGRSSSRFWYELIYNPILDSLHHIVGLTVFVTNITERMRSEQQLKQAEKRYRGYFELGLVGMAITSLDKGWVQVNDKLCEIFGYPRDELTKLTWAQITHPDDLEADEAEFNRVLAGEIDGYSMDKRFIRKDDEVIYASISAGCVRQEDGNIDYFVALVQDITERKQAEADLARLQSELQQAQKMEALGQLTGGIAHDFNNILGIMLGYTELAVNHGVRSGQSQLVDYLKHVEKAGGRAKKLIAQMLAYSRSEARDDKPMQLQPLVEEDLKMLRATLPAGIEIQTKIEEELPDVLMDQTHLNQLLMNLCTNARDAMAGQGTLTIRLGWARGLDTVCSACRKPIEGDRIELSVTDTGNGIEPEALERIFDPFYTTKEVGKGTGMGLSVVHGVVRSHGGHILVTTQPGKGTGFRLLFPPVLEETPDAPAADPSSEALPHGHGEQVLVLDDEPDLGRFLGDLLESYGYQATVLTNSQDALERFKENPDEFDLLITDQTMPGMSGVELVKTLRKARPELAVILNTGFSDEIDAEYAATLGIHYLEKPVSSERLLQAVGELLGPTERR